jgi:hypothetical protein
VEHHLPIIAEKVFEECVSPSFSNFSWNSTKRLKIIKYLIKQGHEFPKKYLAESVQSYDLKIFRWLEKKGFMMNEVEIYETITTKMLWTHMSEEKVQWIMDHNKENCLWGHRFSKFRSLQAALKLKHLPVELLGQIRDPRLQKLLVLEDSGN